jgi:hypothetical protein
VDKQFLGLQNAACKVACAAQFPAGKQYVERLAPRGWKETVSLLEAHRTELAALPSSKRLPVVNDKQRAIATEWMIEVRAAKGRGLDGCSYCSRPGSSWLPP